MAWGRIARQGAERVNLFSEDAVDAGLAPSLDSGAVISDNYICRGRDRGRDERAIGTDLAGGRDALSDEECAGEKAHHVHGGQHPCCVGERQRYPSPRGLKEVARSHAA
jgi:hypothetical protein